MTGRADRQAIMAAPPAEVHASPMNLRTAMTASARSKNASMTSWWSLAPTSGTTNCFEGEAPIPKLIVPG